MVRDDMGRTRDAEEMSHHKMTTLQREIHHHKTVSLQEETLLQEYCDVKW